MKTIGEQVHAFRTNPLRNWTVKEMAQRVGTSRQNIENLEAGTVAVPQYLVALADVMDISTDALLGRPPPANRAAEHHVANPPPPYSVRTLDDALVLLGQALVQVADGKRHAVAENLANWARERGADHYRELLLLLLAGPDGKRCGNLN